ncbi:hypothetical protein [Luteimonas huabeiensis]|uniref:hypothetical protein n=1 Tax=Luteimonas huabeiensis TaxID=1244513 RepID=UPI00046338D6|nr:hypothetical protein [Luteimonas huabeiensis]
MKRTMLSALFVALMGVSGVAAAVPPMPCTTANDGMVYLELFPGGESQWLCSVGHWQLLQTCYYDRPYCEYF